MKNFGKHRGTENFFIIISVIIFGIVAILIANSIVLSNQKRQIKQTTAIFTYESGWSRTGDFCEVVGMGTNENHNKVAVVFSNGLSSKESIDAKRYQVFMLSATNEPLVNMPECTLYSYGNGYFMLMFEDVTPFNDQIYDIIVRDNMNLTVFDESDIMTTRAEESFRQFNQMELILNLGIDSPSVPVLASIPNTDEVPIQPENVYADIVMAEEFDNIVGSLDDTTIKMRTAFQNMESYYQRILDVRTIVPYNIRKDRLLNTMNPELSYEAMFDSAMINVGDQNDSGFSSMFSSEDEPAATQATTAEPTASSNDTEESEIVVAEEGEYYVHFETVFPGQTYFNYHGMSPSDDFLGQVANMSYNDYLTWQSTQQTTYNDQMPYALSSITGFNSDMRYLMNGTEIDMKHATDTSQSELIERINLFESALSQYMALKYEYCSYFDQLYKLQYEKEARIPYITLSNNFEQY